jgi:anti-sigma regulatory factor (Ser/Thr protein kinase)
VSRAELILERPDLSEVRRVRTWVEDRLIALTPIETLGDALLVTSELVTNAVRHGAAAGPVVVEVTSDASTVTIAVTDSGGGVPIVQPPDDSRIGGIGLRIVESIAVSWGVDVTPRSTRVWVVIPL